jgi:hypothetical protein
MVEDSEILDKLELNQLNLGSLLEELRSCHRDRLLLYLNNVQAGSVLEHHILEVFESRQGGT